ncbi:MAG: hypothetical protein J6X30_02470 [Clostridia bacterium]|nr:hypothetical protein [Clostridia bacterium]
MAFCNQCGAELKEGLEFCPQCGAKAYRPGSAEPADVIPAEPVVTGDAQPLAATVSPTKVLVWGILGLAFSELGILGIIFSCVAKKFANTFEQERGMIFGQAKVGRILAKIGFIVGIVMTVFWTLYIIFFIGLFSWLIARGGPAVMY